MQPPRAAALNQGASGAPHAAAPANPLMLLAGAVFAWLLVRMLRRGTVTVKFGTVISRETSPVAYWAVLLVNAVIIVAVFAMGLGLLKR